MRLVLTDTAKADLHDIESYIVQRNAMAAVRVVDQILTIAGMLEDHPKLGRKYEAGVRRLSVPRYPYCLYYRVDEAGQIVIVLTILHTKRIPPTFP